MKSPKGSRHGKIPIWSKSSKGTLKLPPEAKLELSSPGHEAIVERSATISGKTEHLPPQLRRWLLVYAPAAQRWYPVPVADKSDAFTQKITVGSINCDGAKFCVHLFITDLRGSKYLEGYKVDGAWRLPPGVDTTMWVQRKVRVPEVNQIITDSTFNGRTEVTLTAKFVLAPSGVSVEHRCVQARKHGTLYFWLSLGITVALLLAYGMRFVNT